jgi:hypothetical protein
MWAPSWLRDWMEPFDLGGDKDKKQAA